MENLTSLNPAGKNLIDMPVKDILIKNFRTAAVFEKYGIDYCCEGKSELRKMIHNKALPEQMLIDEIQSVLLTKENVFPDFNKMKLDNLISHIISTHHTFIREAYPRIEGHLNKTNEAHKKKYPELNKVSEIFYLLYNDLFIHLEKEEKILFHVIKYLVHCDKFQEKPRTRGFGSVQNPISKMESEHARVANLIQRLTKITNNFNPPADACPTFQLTYKELDEFVKDLFQHIHLENDILFVNAIKLEEKVLLN